MSLEESPMSLPITPPTLPTLPVEIWVNILSYMDNADDSPHLWVFGRQVCTTWRKAIESIFTKQHVPKTTILYKLGQDSDEYVGSVYLDIEFIFSHLSSDNNARAHFKVEPPICHNLVNIIQQDLKAYVIDEPEDYEEPLHIIRLPPYVNDIPVPSLRFKFDRQETSPITLSFSWKELFSRLFGEEVFASTYIREPSMLAEAQARMRAGKSDLDVEYESRKLARRVRIWWLKYGKGKRSEGGLGQKTWSCACGRPDCWPTAWMPSSEDEYLRNLMMIRNEAKWEVSETRCMRVRNWDHTIISVSWNEKAGKWVDLTGR